MLSSSLSSLLTLLLPLGLGLVFLLVIVLAVTFSTNPSGPPEVRLAFLQQPGNILSGNQFTAPVSVKVIDANGNIITSSTITITLSTNPNHELGTLSGGATTVAAVNGIATFTGVTESSTADLPAVFGLQASSPSSSNEAVSDTFTISPGSV